MTRHSTLLAFAMAIVGAVIFSLPTEACKLSGGRKLAEAAGIIVDRTSAKAQKYANAQLEISQLIFFRPAIKKSLNHSKHHDDQQM